MIKKGDTIVNIRTGQKMTFLEKSQNFAKKSEIESVNALKTRLSNNAEKLLMKVRLNSINTGSIFD